MNITEVRMRLIRSVHGPVAVCSIAFDDCFIVHDILIVKTRDDRLIVVMPNRKRVRKCECGENTPIMSVFCLKCGMEMPPCELLNRSYVDVAHPLNQQFRGVIDRTVIDEYKRIGDENNAQRNRLNESVEWSITVDDRNSVGIRTGELVKAILPGDDVPAIGSNLRDILAKDIDGCVWKIPLAVVVRVDPEFVFANTVRHFK